MGLNGQWKRQKKKGGPVRGHHKMVSRTRNCYTDIEPAVRVQEWKCTVLCVWILRQSVGPSFVSVIINV